MEPKIRSRQTPVYKVPDSLHNYVTKAERDVR